MLRKRHVVFVAGSAGPHAIVTVALDGGDAHVVHRFASEHDAPGLGVSPTEATCVHRACA